MRVDGRRAGSIVLLGVALLMCVSGGRGALAAEDLTVFEVRIDGATTTTWSLPKVQTLPLTQFTNRQGKPRTAVLLATLLERSAVPMDRVVAVMVTGLGGDTRKGSATKGIEREKAPGERVRELRGEGLRAGLAGTVLFFNPDRRWTLADLNGSNRGEPWDQTRVRKVQRIDVTLREGP